MRNLLPVSIVTVYMLLLYVIAWYATKLSRAGGGKGFFLAGRGFSSWIIAVMLCGLAVGGASTVGVAQSAYTSGLSAGMYNAAWAAGAIVCGLLAARRLRNMMVYTLPEFLERFYGRSARVIGVIGQLIVVLTIVSLQYVAGGAILTALLPDVFSFNEGMLVTAVAFVGICIIGGYWAAGLSNLVNVIVIYIGLVLGAWAVVDTAGGLEAIRLALPETKWFSLVEGMGWAPIIIWFTVMITHVIGGQGPVQVAFAAKDGQAARWGFILGGLMILPAGFISAIFGITAAMQAPGLANSAMALPTVVLQQSQFVGGIVLAGLWAADVSTAVGLLLGAATMISRDIIVPLQTTRLDKKKEMFLSRFLVLLVAVITLLMAMHVRSVLGTIMIGLSLTAPFTVILLGSFFCPRLCRKSTAFWCLAAGVLIILLWQFGTGQLMDDMRKMFKHVIYPECIASVVIFLLASVLDKRKCAIPDDYAREQVQTEDS